jgi:hypothetical protein
MCLPSAGKLALLLTIFAVLTAPSSALPPQIPIPGAPTTECSFPEIKSTTPIRITTGNQPVPYQFACGVRSPSACAVGTLPSGLVVSFGQEQNGWACVTGGDSTSGWVPIEDLAPLPTTPDVPLSDWLGWWRQGKDVKGMKNDRLLITRSSGSRLLHVSGRAYWYGIPPNVHFGGVQADAEPIGLYLHAIDGGCVLDLKLDPITHTLKVYDNSGCGGMNVRFLGVWNRFTPKDHAK